MTLKLNYTSSLLPGILCFLCLRQVFIKGQPPKQPSLPPLSSRQFKLTSFVTSTWAPGSKAGRHRAMALLVPMVLCGSCINVGVSTIKVIDGY